jgi:hypothetical protein
MQIEGMTELTPPLIDADPAKLPPTGMIRGVTYLSFVDRPSSPSTP